MVSFTTDKSTRLKVLVTPGGDTGFCAYAEVVFTQDDDFAPPLAQGTIDRYNNVEILGIADGDVVKGRLHVSIRATGNINGVTVEAWKVGAILERDKHQFEREDDGSFSLDTRELPPGNYRIIAQGLRVVTENGKTDRQPLYQDEVVVTVSR